MSLDRVDHIVILMLENRSFDQMLGYLTYRRNRPEIEGLRNEKVHANRYLNQTFYTHHTTDTSLDVDPDHEWVAVREQIADRNSGFVTSYAQKLISHGHNPPPDKLLQLVMGHYQESEVYAFDYLAEHYGVCNKWFSSVHGPTQMNRLYSVAGHSDGLTTHKFPPWPYDVNTLFEVLSERGVSWKYFSHDIASLRWVARYLANRGDIQKVSSFYQRASTGDLPSVSWIDPDFASFGNGREANDDHPPADIRNGQALVARVTNALLAGGKDLWKRTMLIVTYDEHGGFYDHVSPPEAPDDRPNFRRYGVRVPALVASPFVGRRAVSDDVYDHTSIIKTVFTRFCRNPDGTLPDLGQRRVREANDLGPLLTEGQPRPPTPLIPLPPERARAEGVAPERAPPVHELQSDMRALGAAAISRGVPADEL